MFTLRQINTDIDSYTQLAQLYETYRGWQFQQVTLHFETWFAANMAAALGGVLDKLAENLNTIQLGKIPPGTERILLKNNFLSHWGRGKQTDLHHTTIQYQKLKPNDGKYFNNYITQQLLARPELPDMSLALKAKMTEAIYEIFVNAKTHSETQHIYTCGQFFPQKHKIEFTIADTGIGFQERINRRFDSKLTAIQAILWAVKDNHTTKTVTGGIGLALLRDFIRLNKGKLQIVSGNGFYQFDVSGEQTHQLPATFPGTVINMQFCTDDPASYLLASEPNLSDIF